MSYLIESTNDSNGLSELPTLRHHPGDEKVDPPRPQKKRRFSEETVNDLIFWAIHLSLVVIALAIVWYRIDVLSRAIRNLLEAQNHEVILMEKQVKAVQAQTDLVTSQAAERQAQIDANKKSLEIMVTSVTDIRDSITDTLKQANAISQTVLTSSQETRTAALQAQAAANLAADASQNAVGAANSAAGAARSAAGAAGAAAARTSATNSLVRSKVVTDSDKVQLQQQEAALAAKRAQLSRTIKQVKKNGPNLIQRIFQ